MFERISVGALLPDPKQPRLLGKQGEVDELHRSHITVEELYIKIFMEVEDGSN